MKSPANTSAQNSANYTFIIRCDKTGLILMRGSGYTSTVDATIAGLGIAKAVWPNQCRLKVNNLPIHQNVQL